MGDAGAGGSSDFMLLTTMLQNLPGPSSCSYLTTGQVCVYERACMHAKSIHAWTQARCNCMQGYFPCAWERYIAQACTSAGHYCHSMCALHGASASRSATGMPVPCSTRIPHAYASCGLCLTECCMPASIWRLQSFVGSQRLSNAPVGASTEDWQVVVRLQVRARHNVPPPSSAWRLLSRGTLVPVNSGMLKGVP